MAVRTRMSLAEYLALPETKPYREYEDGEVIEKPMAGRAHSRLVAEATRVLGNHLLVSREGDVHTELRHIDAASAWVFLPDVSVTKAGRRGPAGEAAQGPEDVLPDLAIEVLSPDDEPGRTTRRVSYYLRAGVTLVWIVDPRARAITVFERGAEPRVVREGDVLSARPVLSEFDLDVSALFAVLDPS